MACNPFQSGKDICTQCISQRCAWGSATKPGQRISWIMAPRRRASTTTNASQARAQKIGTRQGKAQSWSQSTCIQCLAQLGHNSPVRPLRERTRAMKPVALVSQRTFCTICSASPLYAEPTAPAPRGNARACTNEPCDRNPDGCRALSWRWPCQNPGARARTRRTR